MGRRVGFARWRSDLPSGGNRYDDELAAALRAFGLDVREYAIAGPWPLPNEQDRQQLTHVLTAEHDWLIDNIVGSAAPDTLAAAITAGRRVTMLIHYFPADDPTLSSSDRELLASAEAEAVTMASAVVVTSRWAADEVWSRYGRDDAVVAVPGVKPAKLVRASSPSGQSPMLLWLGRLTQTKDPLTFVEALILLHDLDWTARLVGPDTVDDDLNRRVRHRIAEADLAGRIEVAGSRVGEALECVWAQSDLLVHTSRSETYGMVVGEALARGIPSVVPAETGAAEAQKAGATFPPGDVDALASALRSWMTDPQLKKRWRADAANARAHLPTWEGTAEIISSALVT